MKRLKNGLSLAALAFILLSKAYGAGSIQLYKPTITPIQIYQIQPIQINLPTIVLPTVSLPQIYLPMVNLQMINPAPIQLTQIIPTMVTPQFQNFIPTLIGSDVRMETLIGLKFDDIHIANPDLRKDAKSITLIAKEELARFGLVGPVKSPLEAEFLAGLQPPTPLTEKVAFEKPVLEKFYDSSAIPLIRI